MIAKPTAEEFAPFYTGYIEKVPPSGPIATLEAQRSAVEAFGTLREDKASYRYAEGKWSVKEVLGHVSDAERVFGYRLVRIARNDTTPLAGFDENAWAAVAPHHHRSIGDIVEELLAVRAATLALIHSMDDAALARQTVANSRPVSGRALVWILAGHCQHHLGILYERYGVTDALGALTTKAWEPGILGD
jgi:uncharacterized damage-inducible protein DinB